MKPPFHGLAPLAILAILFSFPSGCQDERISKLEKQNQELLAEVKRNNAVADYDLQAKCAKDANEWFKDNWGGRDKDQLFLNHTNHYNKSRNKCFILVEYHYRSSKDVWTNDISLWDVYENSKYGNYDEDHTTVSEPQLKIVDTLATCGVFGQQCKTLDEFNNLVQPYMNN